MNIFVTDPDPSVSAQVLPDKWKKDDTINTFTAYKIHILA